MSINRLWRELRFLNYENFDNLGIALNNFINRLDCVVKLVAPFKIVRVNNNTNEWFDREIADKIHTRDKLYKNFKLTQLHVDEEIFQEVQNTVQNLILKKKQAYFEEKLKEKIKKSEKTLGNIKAIRSGRQKVTFY